MANLQHYPLPDGLRKQLLRADSVAARMHMQRQPVPDCITLNVSEYMVAERIVSHISGKSSEGLVWNGRPVICADAA